MKLDLDKNKAMQVKTKIWEKKGRSGGCSNHATREHID